jgi:phosphoribosylaminoimidazolecarboxamide formyltransferase/IMP cyclohydrolase
VPAAPAAVQAGTEVAVGRALVSVSDKTGLVPFAEGLIRRGFSLVASGGTARALRDAGLAVTEVARVTGAPEILGGRVKTLHPAIAGGILARDTEEHRAELAAHGYQPFDVVVCNLYPFEATVAKGVDPDVAVEEIDVGGVTLLRAAAKNHERVIVVVDPADYDVVLSGMDDGTVDRRGLARKAFARTAAYDAAIAAWLADEDPLPASLVTSWERVSTLRYGENPHQRAAWYRPVGADDAFRFVQGKELSYNNLLDLDAAWGMPFEFDRAAVAIIKHGNPAGLAVADDVLLAWDRALATDPVSAFGGVVATNRPVDAAFVARIGKLFLEVLAAPVFSEEAVAWLGRHKPNCRVLVGAPPRPGRGLRSIAGGLVVQTSDDRGADPTTFRVVTARAPTDAQLRDLAFAIVAAKHTKSNAIVLASGEATVGVGAGQMSRVDAVHLAVRRAGERAAGSVLASDAFFPFPDGIEAAAAAGVVAVAQPGGSVRDDEVIAAADRLGLAMVFTGERHFRH